MPVAQRSATPLEVASVAPAEEQQSDQPAPHGTAAGPAAPDDDPAAAAGGTDAEGNSGRGSGESDAPAEDPEKQIAADPGGDDDRAEPDMDAFDVTASVDPTCARAGETITITVDALPNAGVAYNAIYSDGKGGAPPPYGGDYGGNDGGMAGQDGRYRDSWTVGPTAPSGSGHVDVLAGAKGGYGKARVAFAIADPVTGKCDP